MSSANGSVGVCHCGRMAVGHCTRCNTSVCDAHANELPPTPDGISADAAAYFTVAIRSAPAGTCTQCRAQMGHHALHQSVSSPRAPLPAHWLDRAMALTGDHSRSDLEKAEDADLPSSLTATEVAQEFLRRMEQAPRERVPITPSTVLRTPDYVEGWTVDCRRTQHTAPGTSGARYPLPCLISVHGELLGPTLEDGDQASSTWWLVDQNDIELPRLVSSVANILLLSAFVNEPSG